MGEETGRGERDGMFRPVYILGKLLQYNRTDSDGILSGRLKGRRNGNFTMGNVGSF